MNAVLRFFNFWTRYTCSYIVRYYGTYGIYTYLKAKKLSSLRWNK